MKLLLTLATAAALTLSAHAADAPTFFKKGDHLRLQLVSPLQDGASTDVTVQDFGPSSWVLVEYERVFSKPGESGLKNEKAQIWINFNHVISAKLLPAK
jgi:hypothetical protein